MTTTRWVTAVSAALLVAAAGAAVIEDHATRTPARSPAVHARLIPAIVLPALPHGRFPAASPITPGGRLIRPYPGGSPPVGMRAPHDWRTP